MSSPITSSAITPSSTEMDKGSKAEVPEQKIIYNQQEKQQRLEKIAESLRINYYPTKPETKPTDIYYCKTSGKEEDKLFKQFKYAVEEGWKNNDTNHFFDIYNPEKVKTEYKEENQTIDWIEHWKRYRQGGRPTVVRDETIDDDKVGVVETLGRRSDMEDAHLVTKIDVNGQKIDLYAVFDGHGDKGKAAEYVKKRLVEELTKELSKAKQLDEKTIPNILTQIMVNLDAELKKDESFTGGTTVLGVLRLAKEFYTFNVGDSRAVFAKRFKNSETVVLQLNEEANLSKPRFQRSIKKSSHPIIEHRGIPRVDGRLSVARDLKSELVTARPKITRMRKGDDVFEYQETEGEYLILACDGFWNVCNNSELGKAIDKIDPSILKDPQHTALYFVQAALKRRVDDNITFMFVKL